MDLDSSRVLQEIKENSATIAVLREIFEAEAEAETNRSAAAALVGDLHGAVVSAARSDAFDAVIDRIMEYGVNDNG